MDRAPLVSIIIPTKNNENTLWDCLKSISDQTHKNIEVLIIDAYSSDETKTIAERFGARVVSLRGERMQAKNHGLRLALGSYVLFLDSDMVLEPDVVEECLKLLTEGIGGVIIPEKSVGGRYWVRVRDFERGLYAGSKIESARFFRKDLAIRAGGFDETSVFYEESTLPQKIERLGFRTDRRISSFIHHLEEGFSMRLWLRKKRYYFSNRRSYSSKYGDYAASQSSISYRLGIFLSRENRHQLFQHPHLAAGLVFLKSLEYFASKCPTNLHDFFKIPFIISALILLFNLVIWSGVLGADGYLITGDFNFPLTNENLINNYVPLWNDHTSQTNFERIPRLVLMSPFLLMAFAGLEVSLILKILLISTYSFMMLSMYWFLQALQTKFGRTEGRTMVSLFGAFLFAYNPIMMQFSGGISMLISLAVTPLMFGVILRKYESKYFPILIASLLLLSLGHPFTLIMNIVVSAGFLLITKKLDFLMLRQVILTSISFMLLFAWYWIPFSAFPVSYTTLGREENLSRDIVNVISDNPPEQILIMERERFIYVDTIPEQGIQSTFHFASLGIIIAFVFLVPIASVFQRIRLSALRPCWLMRKLEFLVPIASVFQRIRQLALAFSKFKHERGTQAPLFSVLPLRLILFVFFGFLIAFFLALGTNGPFGEAYYEFVTSNEAGWIFRSPLKFQLYQALFVPILFAIAISSLWNRVGRMTLLLAICVVLIGVSSFGIINANSLSLNPIPIPIEYWEAQESMEIQDREYRVAYYPVYQGRMTSWSQGHDIGTFDARSSFQPTIEVTTNDNRVKEMIELPYYNSTIFQNYSFYDYLSSIGVKYIVFHNDRNVQVDDDNLSYLKNTYQTRLIYENNDWYVFELRPYSSPLPRVVSAVGIVENRNDIFLTAKPALPVISKQDSPQIEDPTLSALHLYDLSGPITTNQQYSDLFDLQRNYDDTWKNNNGIFSASVYSTSSRIGSESEEKSSTLKVMTSQKHERSWSWLFSNPVEVSEEEVLLFSSEVMTQNVQGTHLKLQGFFKNENSWKDISYVTTGINGDSEFTEYRSLIQPTNEMSLLRYVINAGTVLDEGNGPASTWVRNTSLVRINHNNTDSVTLVDYQKEEATEHLLTVNSTMPYIIIMPEVFNSGWHATIDGEDISAIPVNGILNGFIIDKTGENQVRLEYLPQYYLELGLWISIGFISLVMIHFLFNVTTLIQGVKKRLFR